MRDHDSQSIAFCILWSAEVQHIFDQKPMASAVSCGESAGIRDASTAGTLQTSRAVYVL